MKEEYYELTAPQKSIWLTEQYYQNTNVNNVCGTFYSSENLDFNILKKSLNAFLKNNDSFKIKLKLIDNDVKQYFSEIENIDFEIVDVKNKEEQVKLEEKLASETFTMLNSLLFKIVLFRYPDNHGGFVINSHHIISDSWTNGLVANDVALIYSKIKNNEDYSKDNELSYRTYIQSELNYQNSPKFQKDKDYWNKVFATVPEVATVPSIKDSSKAQENLDAMRLLFNLDKNLFNRLKSYCDKNKVSLYNFFMTIFALYLGRVSNLDEFVIGTPILNRTNYKEKQTAGMFINTLPLKINLSHDKTFLENLRDIAVNSMSLLRHQKYSFQYIIEDLRKRDASLPKLYNVLYSYQVTKMNENMDALEHTTSWTFNKTITDDLDIHMFEWNENDSIQIAYDYQINKYDEQDIKDLHARILHVINQVLEDKDILLRDIEIVTTEEKHKILYEFNNTKVDYPKDKTIVDFFEEQVKKTPDNIAVVFEDQKLTYKELNEKANQLARYLVQQNIKKNDIVLILLNRSLEMIISILAVLKSGAAYLPIDPTYPTDRIKYIIKDSNCKLTLTASNLFPNNTKTIYLDNIFDSINNYSVDNLNLPINQESISYVIYTSGSTGKPKGVILKHLSLSNLVNYCNSYVDYLKHPSYRAVVSVTTVSFDIFLFETLISLQKGLKLVIANYDEQTLPDKLNELIKKENIKIIQTTPSRMQLLCNNLEVIPNLSNLEYIILAGEQLPITLLKTLKKITNAEVYNGYGPSETTVFSTLTKVTNQNKITIGKPLQNTKIYILDKTNNLCPINTPGEIYISGDCVGYGYINNKPLTLNSFMKDSFFRENIMYKSGDLGYYQKDGEIICLGRTDHQVKIRGLRIELAEIEKTLLNISNIINCTVVKKIDNFSHEFLCAYFVKDGPVNIANIRSILQKTLPNYMIPQYFIELKELPYTPNGKIDTKSLPLPKIKHKEKIIPARNNIDTILLQIFKKSLNTQSISITDSLYDLGGDSLSAINIATSIYHELNVHITTRDIYEHPIIEDLSDYIALISDNLPNNSIKKAKKQSYYPLSSAQARIYYSCLKEENSLLYNIAGGVILDTELDREKLEECFKLLIKRHSSLRTYFEAKNNNIVQIVEDTINFHLDFEEANTNNMNEIYSNFVKPFNLSKAPLFRVKLIKLKNKKSLLLIDMHHIISDGTSLNVLLQELCALYNDQKLSNKKIEYKDFTVWEQGQINTKQFNESKEFWVNQFKDEIPLLNMPTVYPRPSVQSFEGSNYHTQLSKEIYRKIIEVAKELNITPYMLLLSVYYVLLSKYTSQDDIIVGTPVVGRDLPELSNVLGMFVNSLPLRNKIDHHFTFEEFSKQIKENCLNSFKNQDYPFDMLVKDLDLKRDPSRNPLFDTMFIYQSEGYPSVNFDGINAEYFIPDNSISKFDLSLEIVPINNEYHLRFEYCTKLFDENFIKRFSSHYINILNTILENIEIKIADIDMLSEEEKRQILDEFNNTKVEYPKDKTIVDLFEEQVEKTPDNVAVIFEDEKLTYMELNKKANQLARFLLANNVNQGSVIGIMLPRSANTIVTMLAVLKLGCTYFLVDSSLPKDRILYMLKNCNCSLLIVNTEESSLNFKDQININENTSLYCSGNINYSISPLSPFTIIYTSGSTGNPKGVILTHQGLNNMVNNYIKVLDINRCANFLSISSIAFDMFIVEVFITILTGKTLILSNEEQQKIPLLIHDLIKNHNVNFVLTTPSRINLMLSQNLLNDLSSIKIIQLGGEVFTVDLYHQLSRVTNADIYNGYGPSEITACCSSKKIIDSTISIGKPFNNFNIYVLDKDNKICPIDVPGEICISGDGVSLGYINNRDLTDKVFIKNSPFGKTLYKSGDLGLINKNYELEYIGRIDNQIKIRGLRIELSEIESQLLKISGIADCAVLYKLEQSYISAFIVCNSDEVNYATIKKELKKSLPAYMIPKYITKIDQLPITTNGKIDKKKLLTYPEDKPTSHKVVQATSDEEKLCCAIWKKLLGIDIGITDNIFDLGADSLLAIKFKTQMLSHNIDIPYADIFKYPTIKDLCNKSRILYTSHDTYDYSDINTLLEHNNIKEITNIVSKKNNNILLLGANGFVGMHILYNFIKYDQGNIYCVVRDKNKQSAYNRFVNILHFYFENELDKFLNKRIFVLNGNILKENFGLSSANIDILSKNIDIVINSAAIVKHYGNEKEFNDINIGSTNVAINFCKCYHKRLIHISSLSVSGNASLSGYSSYNTASNDISFAENNLYIGQSLDNVYIHSKFLAERLILENITKNSLDAQIMRLGNITNRLHDGKFQINPKDNAFVNRVKTLINIGFIPNNLLSSYIEFTPVDVCSYVIILLMQNYIKNFTVFHLYDNNHVFISDFIKYLSSLNININVVTPDEFGDVVNRAITSNTKNLDGIINDLDENNRISYDSNIKISSEFTRAVLYHLGFHWPVIDKQYLEKFLKNLNLI